MWNVSSSLVHKWSVRLLLTLEKFIRCFNQTLESHRYYSWFSISVVSLGWFKLFLLSNYVIYHVRILKLFTWFVQLNLFVWLIQWTCAVSFFFFFFSLSKNKYVICCIIFRSIKLIVYTIYGTPRFLVVTCLFSSNETMLLRTIN